VPDITVSPEQGVVTPDQGSDKGPGADQGPGADKGSTPDKAAPDWGTPDIQPPDEGCNCDAGSAGDSPPLWMLLGIMTMALLRRRRRR